MPEENNPLTRNSDITVIERIKREPKFGRELLREAALDLGNCRQLDVVQAQLRVIAEAVFDNEASSLYPALYRDERASAEEMEPIHDAIFKKLVAIDPTIGPFERVNWHAFARKHKNDPPEPGGIMAISPELYKEMFGDGGK